MTRLTHTELIWIADCLEDVARELEDTAGESRTGFATLMRHRADTLRGLKEKLRGAINNGEKRIALDR